MYRRLVPGGDVGSRGVVERVDAAEQALIDRRELVALLRGRRGQVGNVAVRQQVDLDGPARGERHERSDMLAADQDPLPGLLEGEDVGEHRRAVAVERGEQAGRAGGDVGVGVDLAVRVVQRDSDRLAAILEREDLLHAGQGREGTHAVGPGLDDGSGAGGAQRGE